MDYYLFQKTTILFLAFIFNLLANCSALDLQKNPAMPKYRHYTVEHTNIDAASSSKSGSSIALQWNAPKTNTDGTPIDDLAGYEVYYGKSGLYNTIPIDSRGLTGIVINNLSPGKWCFKVRAYDVVHNTSDFSEEVCTEVK